MNMIDKTPTVILWAIQLASLIALWRLIHPDANEWFAGGLMALYGITMYCIGRKES